MTRLTCFDSIERGVGAVREELGAGEDLAVHL